MLRRRRPRVISGSVQLPRRWPRHAGIVGVVALLAAAVAYDRLSRPPVQGSDHSRYHDRSFRVAHVVDGDTIDIAIPDQDKPVTRIRLLGVDAPEVSRMDRRGEWLGAEATNYLRERLLGRYVDLKCERHNLIDRYGRLLAFVYLDGSLVNAELIEQGLAYAYTRFSHGFADEFLHLETQAREEKRGLWQPWEE